MPRTRMSKADRREQLLEIAADIVREGGAEQLTLLTLAERAGVSKPITYNHFGDRQGLLLQLYQGYDERLVQDVRTLAPGADCSLKGLAHKLAVAYFKCTVRNGAVYDDVVAALCTFPEHRDLRTRICQFFVAFYRDLFAPAVVLSPEQDSAVLIAIYGASDELARALTAGLVGEDQAVDTLTELIVRLLSPTSV